MILFSFVLVLLNRSSTSALRGLYMHWSYFPIERPSLPFEYVHIPSESSQTSHLLFTHAVSTVLRSEITSIQLLNHTTTHSYEIIRRVIYCPQMYPRSLSQTKSAVPWRTGGRPLRSQRQIFQPLIEPNKVTCKLRMFAHIFKIFTFS